MRRTFLPITAAAVFCLCVDVACGHAAVLRLKARGHARPLNPPVFGASTTAFFEPLLGDPAKTGVLKTMSIGLARFPGGSDSNFYNWRTGLIEVRAGEDSSGYMRFWEKAAAQIAQEIPGGISLEQFEPFARGLGAEVVLVPNLESSDVGEQKEWFRRLSRRGIVPKRVELGNEFAIAMGGDPASLRRWPDEPTSMRIMKEYLDGIRECLPAGAKIAVQAGWGSCFGGEDSFLGRRLREWDAQLHPEPWFDAVALHLYPFLRDVMDDPSAGSTPATRENAQQRLDAMLAHVDAGVDRIIAELERKVPGKEIWVTEWNARGADPSDQRVSTAAEPLSCAMEMLATVRMAFVQLRHAPVTVSLYFMLSFRDNDPHALFLADGRGGYEPLPAAEALRWLNEAANAGGYFRRLVQSDAKPVAGSHGESYLAVEAGLFVSPLRTTLILENASAAYFTFDPRSVAPGVPAFIETLAASAFPDPRAPARIASQEPGGVVSVPPYSLTRIVWEK